MNTCQLIQIPITEQLIAKKRIFDIYNIHKMIWELWDDHNGDRPFIFRQNKDKLNILISKEIENPDVDWLKGAFVSKKINVNLNGTLRYEVVVNPVKQIAKDEKTKNCKVAITSDQEIIDWWESKGELFGFEAIEGSTSVHSKKKIFFRKDSVNTSPLFTVCISGYLNVTDTQKFSKAYVHGFGRSKCFGCGLMIIKK